MAALEAVPSTLKLPVRPSESEVGIGVVPVLVGKLKVAAATPVLTFKLPPTLRPPLPLRLSSP